ncbi:hypothetical protein Ancab_025433 [Ancistrocladus abbreviatus]
MSIEPVVSYVVQRIGDLLCEEVKFLFDVEDRVYSLRKELIVMQSYLKDAEAKQDHVDRDKVREIISIAYDLEDIIESFILNSESRSMRKESYILKCFCFCYSLNYIHQVGKEVEAIQKRIQETTTMFERLQLTTQKNWHLRSFVYWPSLYDINFDTRPVCENLRFLRVLHIGYATSELPEALGNLIFLSWSNFDTFYLHRDSVPPSRITIKAAYLKKSADSMENFSEIMEDHIHKLALEVEDDTELPSLGPLSHSHNLSSLSLCGSLQQLPLDYGGLPRNLTKLILENSKLSQDHMPFLGELPYLKHLYLGHHAYIGCEMVCKENSFLALGKLELYMLSNLRRLKVEDGALPQLKYLQIPMGLMIPRRLRSLFRPENIDLNVSDGD